MSPNPRVCERCKLMFDYADIRDFYCSKCVGELMNEIRQRGGKSVVTADEGKKDE